MFFLFISELVEFDVMRVRNRIQQGERGGRPQRVVLFLVSAQICSATGDDLSCKYPAKPEHSL